MLNYKDYPHTNNPPKKVPYYLGMMNVMGTLKMEDLEVLICWWLFDD